MKARGHMGHWYLRREALRSGCCVDTSVASAGACGDVVASPGIDVKMESIWGMRR